MSLRLDYRQQSSNFVTLVRIYFSTEHGSFFYNIIRYILISVTQYISMQVTDIQDYIGANQQQVIRLSPAEIKRALRLRVEFSKKTITQLNL